jgi:hypothetical protein
MSFSEMLKQTVAANSYEKLQQLVNTMLERAIDEGDPYTAKLLIERLDGAVKQSVALEHSGHIDSKIEQVMQEHQDPDNLLSIYNDKITNVTKVDKPNDKLH